MEGLKLKVVKKFNKQKITILEEVKNGFFVFKAGKNFICIRHSGSVLLDNRWEKKTDQSQKFKLKDFLGGMYIAEVKKEIRDGSFKIADLNSLIQLY